MKIVVDSSVLVASVKEGEAFHKESKDFFREASRRGDEIVAPATLLWEIGAALDHPEKTPKGSKFAKDLGVLDVKFIAVNGKLFQRTWQSDLRLCVKGADRIFLSCALAEEALLVTWDSDLKKNTGAVGVTVLLPTEYLSMGKS
ncbi:PIN domain-containing protein [Acidobacteria bacterium AH-259-A15]|nr:PIN domain-containing protein [Acidobacteria bacterium AH-259-A15]